MRDPMDVSFRPNTLPTTFPKDARLTESVSFGESEYIEQRLFALSLSHPG